MTDGLLLLGRKKVVTLDGALLRQEMRCLWQQVLDSGDHPQAVIGIATGGALCAQLLAEAVGVPLMTCTMRRKSTETKTTSPFTRILRYMPYALTDRLRRYEDRTLERRARAAGPASIPAPSQALEEDIAGIVRVVSERGLGSVLVIDDAVDSGATLGCVMGAMRAALPPNIRLRSAVLTQTRSDPVFSADFSLYHLVLCRFPWSFDFRGI